MSGPLDNARFAPGADAGPPHHAFAGTLVVAETAMSFDPAAVANERYFDKRVDLFPACELGFVSVGGALIPTDQEIQRPRGGNSFWDIILSPGHLWSEPADDGRTRAGFPFVLSNSLENDAHNGLATFLFNDDGVSDLRFQIVQETATFLLSGGFDAWGAAATTLSDNTAAVTAPNPAPLRPWSDLAAHCGSALLNAAIQGGSETAIVSGLVMDGEIYATPSRTRHGDYPYPQQMRHGVWSVTKSAAATMTMLRLAQKYGDDVFGARVGDYMDVTADHDGWDRITLGDCLNMASGIGNAQPTAEPIAIHADNDTDGAGAETYRRWYDRPSAQAKIDACFSYANYPWGPGEVARYRDPDIFMAGAVMDAIYKRHEGPDADLWAMMRREVYAPIGIDHLPKNRTIEGDGSPGLALMAFGLFLTLEDCTRIAQLLHDGGKAGDAQLLSPTLLDRATDPTSEKGLPTGDNTVDGPVTYHMAFWHYPYRDSNGRLWILPKMSGYGGNMVLLLPNGMTALRFAHDPGEADEKYDVLAYARIADAIRPF
jgi:hypothetical protein